jgi:2-polyprenyl-6-methoxyphenol hydroxylase-like FAD-dependent oxidoreductase
MKSSSSGYPFVFMDRHFLLQTLYDAITDKSKILLGKRISRVDHSGEGISVQCRDGTTYHGDVVVGADGVHSIVRHEMWRHMDSLDPSPLSKTERNCEFELVSYF